MKKNDNSVLNNNVVVAESKPLPEVAAAETLTANSAVVNVATAVVKGSDDEKQSSVEADSLPDVIESVSEADDTASDDGATIDLTLKPIVEEKVRIPDGEYIGTITDAFCYNLVEERIMLKFKLDDGSVFVNPVRLEQLSRHPYAKLVSQAGAKTLSELVGVKAVFTVRSKLDSDFSYIKKINIA